MKHILKLGSDLSIDIDEVASLHVTDRISSGHELHITLCGNPIPHKISHDDREVLQKLKKRIEDKGMASSATLTLPSHAQVKNRYWDMSIYADRD